MNFKLNVFLHLGDEEARILYRAILPEVRDAPSRRTSVKLELVEGGVILGISAADPVALRAASNSFLRFIDSVLRSIRLL
ncbi:MAG: hypothetical protein DRN64_01530 [Thaumarchaeota archaeon]|nr:MAG: hypothetical protein DRN64_01530 [Nitrososphaerota archaeon]